MPNDTAFADLVLRGGTILTLDRDRTRATAIAVRGDRIAAVGTGTSIDAMVGPKTRVVELAGRTVIPGFNDAHAHMEREGLKAIRLSLAGAHSVGDILERIAATVRATRAGQWIVTMPVGTPPYFFGGPATLAEGRMPTRQELDAVAPNHPVCISGVFGNWGRPPGYTMLNTLALELNGIGTTTEPRSTGIEIVKDPTSRAPTGLIIEHNSRPIVEFDLLPALPRFEFADRRDAARESMRLYNAVGTTSAYEGHGAAPEIISVYRSLWERDEMTVRVALVVSPTWANVAEATEAMRDFLGFARGRGSGDSWLRFSGVHVAFGGDAEMAALARADLPNTGWSGFVEQATTRQEFRDYCFLAAEHDFRVHTIVGDQLHEVVPIMAEVAERYAIAERRWVVEHIGRARPEDLSELKRLGLYVTTIPVYHLWKSGAYLNEPDGGDFVVPHRHLLERGIPLAVGTDNIPYDPLFTLWCMCAREDRSTGRTIGPVQRLSVDDALPLLTTAGSWLTFEEERKGPLRQGNFADLAVLSENPVGVSIDRLPRLKCCLTMVGGRIVFDDI